MKFLISMAVLALAYGVMVLVVCAMAAPSCGGDCNQGRKPCECNGGKTFKQ